MKSLSQFRKRPPFQRSLLVTSTLLLGLSLSAHIVVSSAAAAPLMYVDDSGGRLGIVDVSTGAVDLVGNMGTVMTDIAFDPVGNLYGLSFSNFYAIDATDASTTLIGAHGINDGNALVFGADGTLYAAGNSTSALYTIDPATGSGLNIGDMGVFSGGDLAFNGSDFFLASTASELVSIDLTDVSNSSIVGSFGVVNVYGLATGDDGLLYAVADTTIFNVDTTTGLATNPQDFSGQGLGQAFGQSFFAESGAPGPGPNIGIYEPKTLALLGLGLVALVSVRLNRANRPLH